jgi:integrase
VNLPLTNVRGSKLRTQRETVITDVEFQAMLNRASQIKNEFMKLRACALLCLLRLVGKRREEIARLKLDSFKVENSMLNITFILEKKRKGSVLQRQAVKSIPLSDPLVQPILSYIDYLTKLESKPQYFFPSVRSVFGQTLIIYPGKHLTGRQIFNIVRSLSSAVWCHLFRETVGSDVIKQDSSIIGAFKVMRRLDLEDYRTGFNYLKRYAADIIEKEEKAKTEETVAISH